jgi:ABC-type amino acid transport substrate-binding protein
MFIFLFALLIPRAFSQENSPIEVGLSDIAPISYMKNGKLAGINIDILEQVKKSSNLNFDYQLYPHARLKKILDNGTPDLLIIFRPSCAKNNHLYEIQKTLYTIRPAILLRKDIDPKKPNLRISRVIGMCQELSARYVKKENIVDVANMDQAFRMLQAGKLDGICGNGPIVNYNMQNYPSLKKKLFVYRTMPATTSYDAVICRKKTLSLSVKKKLDEATKNIVVPTFKHQLI